MKRYGFILACVVVAVPAVAMFFAPVSAYAVYDLTNPIWNGRYAVSCAASNTPCSFCDGLRVVVNIIDGLTLLAIPIAVLVIGYGGFRIMTSGSSSAGMSAGWGAIRSAGIGVVVALGAWLIVNTVFSLLSGGTGLSGIECEDSGIFRASKQTLPAPPGGGEGTCPIPPFTTATGDTPLGVLWNTLPNTPNCSQWQDINRNLQNLRQAVQCLQSHITNTQPTSAYRPLVYQKHLYEIYVAAKYVIDRRGSAQDPFSIPACTSLIQTISSETSRHGICRSFPNPITRDTPCLVARPNSSAPHTRGVGVDIPVNNLGGWINQRLDAANCNIRWQNAQDDYVHFNLYQDPSNPSINIYSGPGC